MKQIAIFASGSGSNAEQIIRFFNQGGSSKASVACLLANKPDAYALIRAQQLDVPTLVFDRQQWSNPEGLLAHLQEQNIDLIVLAGFLWLVPDALLQAYAGRIVNIHPSLLPKYGGKGMYGMRVHQAVKEAAEQATGITIHYVTEEYDQGDIIFQASCSVLATDTPEDIAGKVHALEHQYFPQIIDSLL